MTSTLLSFGGIPASRRSSLHRILIVGTLLFLAFAMIKATLYTITFYSSGSFVKYHMDMTPFVLVHGESVNWFHHIKRLPFDSPCPLKPDAMYPLHAV